jgi:hypothetical protein
VLSTRRLAKYIDLLTPFISRSDDFACSAQCVNKRNVISLLGSLITSFWSVVVIPINTIMSLRPEGCINTGHQRTGLNQTTSFVFTLTEKDSNRQRFGICVNFYRHISRRTYSLSTHAQQKPDHTDSSDDGAGTRNHSLTTHDLLSADGSENNERKRKRRLRNNTLTSICLISHHPFFTRFRECLMTLKTIIDACNERSCAKRTGASRGTSR